MKSMLIIGALAVLLLVPQQVPAQEPLKLIYSQFTMTNSATWFAREAGLFERHGLNADLIYVDSAPAVQALTAGAAPLATMSGGLAVSERLGLGHAGGLVQFELLSAYYSSRDPPP